MNLPDKIGNSLIWLLNYILEIPVQYLSKLAKKSKAQVRRDKELVKEMKKKLRPNK